MKRVMSIHINEGDDTIGTSFMDEEIHLRWIGCGGDPERARTLIAEFDGKVDAIGLDALPAGLELGQSRREHAAGASLKEAARFTPVVDGSGIRNALERWGVTLADEAQPGIFSGKRILLVPGLNHNGLAHGLARYSKHIRYADPVVYFAMPDFPGVGARQTLEQVAGRTLDQLVEAPFRRITPQPGMPGTPRSPDPFLWADVLAGDIGAIRRYAPKELRRKIVVVNASSEEDLQDLRARGVSIVITLIPDLNRSGARRGVKEGTVEAILAALRPNHAAPLTEDTYLDMLADLEWSPDIQYLQPDEAGINRFAFVIHPLDVSFIHQHRWFRWTRFLPDSLVETIAAWIPPMYLSRIKGGLSPTTGQRIEGFLLALGATPRQMMRHNERFTYLRLNQAAKMAEQRGARIMGLGAFTSVVGDAGITVAHESSIAITSGNSLTVAATLEAAKQAVLKMGAADLTQGKVMVIGATGSIGSVCARLLAQAIFDVVLVSIEPEKLINLKRRIQAETPRARVTIATRPDNLIQDCDLIVTATSAFGQRILDITLCKPGAVICDVARPPDINQAEADLRPDVLVIESGEVLIPGEIDFGYDIGLPPKTAYACLAETALLAMEGRFEDYTLGRNISIERVKEIYHLFKKHQFQLAGLRSFGKYIQDEDLAYKQEIADRFRSDPALFARHQRQAVLQLAEIPIVAKGVQASKREVRKWLWLAAGLGLFGWLISRRKQSGPHRSEA